MKIKPIVLASGFSRRFGTNKLLYPVGGRPLFRHILDTLILLAEEGKVEPPLVVTQYKEIYSLLVRDGVDCVLNSNAQEGISASIKTGIYHSTDWDAYLFLTADQPYLKTETLNRFINAYKASGKPLGCMQNKRAYGAPAIFSSAYKQELLRLTGETGGKAVLKNHLEEVFFFTASDDELRDIDRPGDIL